VNVERLITHRREYTDAPEMYAAPPEDRTRALGVLFDWT